MSVRGKAAPEIAYNELLLAAEFTVTVPPVALIVEVCALELPISTLPKLRDPGETVSWPVVELVPVPLNETVKPGPGRNTLPLDDPDAVGAKVAFRVALCPCPSVRGRLGPLTVKPVPEVWYEVTTTFPY